MRMGLGYTYYHHEVLGRTSPAPYDSESSPDEQGNIASPEGIFYTALHVTDKQRGRAAKLSPAQSKLPQKRRVPETSGREIQLKRPIAHKLAIHSNVDQAVIDLVAEEEYIAEDNSESESEDESHSTERRSLRVGRGRRRKKGRW